MRLWQAAFNNTRSRVRACGADGPCATEARLRRLEADVPAKRVRFVFSMNADPAEWDREIATMMASGRAPR